ncbi:MAG TPA: hypothetical protein VMT90_09765 [Dehalococcoidia bacterium]|jgi:hypothetical protein|nr:hypothetical protein [Dehalococcoidia bacterium]
MKDKKESPSVLRELSAVAGLYRNVVWMIGQRVQRGPDWQQRLFEDAVRRDEMAERREEAAARR